MGEVVIDKYSHYFKVSGFGAESISILNGFCVHLTHFTTQKKANGRFERIQGKVFATRTADKNEYRFPITVLDHFIPYVEGKGFYKHNVVRIEEHYMYKPEPIDIKLNPEIQPRGYQIPILDFTTLEDKLATIKIPKYRRVLPIQTGRGKDQPLTSLIKVPGGWKTMGDMKLGEKIIASDGTVTDVIGVFPQGKKDVYKITFEDGRTAECGLEHLWAVHHLDLTFTSSKDIVTTDEIIKTLPFVKLGIPLVQPERSVDVDQSVLDETYNRVMAHFKEENYDSSFINQFLNNSDIHHLPVLQAILDSNAFVETNNAISLPVATYAFYKDVQYLVRSLGGIATLNSNDKTQCLIIRHPAIRSLVRQKIISIENSASPMYLGIMSVKYVGVKETQCIAIAHPEHLYVTDNYVVTHNTLISLMTIAKLQVRTAIVLRSMYIQQWIEAIRGDKEKNIGAFNYPKSKWDDKDLLVVQGGKDLATVIALAKANQLHAKIIIFSNRTLANYIQEYEQLILDELYECTPDKLFETLGVGLRLTDEIHLDFHANFKLDLYTHVPLSIELSATLDPSDTFLKKMYKLMLPLECRYTGLAYDQYIAVTGVFYYLDNPKQIKYQQRSMYNHNVFEESIKKHPKVQKRYHDFIGRMTRDIFVTDFKPLQKCLIFCGKIETCQAVGAFLQQLFPTFTVGVFVGGSDETILKDSDIIVSTRQSCGTAKDIPNLVSVLDTVAADTNQGNEQALGRLRPIKAYPDMVPRYYYFICADIPKHVQYHRSKMKTFHGKVKSHGSVNSGIRI